MTRKQRRPGASSRKALRPHELHAAVRSAPALSEDERARLDRESAAGAERLAAILADRRRQDPVVPANDDTPTAPDPAPVPDRAAVESQLRRAHIAAQRAIRHRDGLVVSARRAGMSWHAIGVVLGMTGEGVRARFRGLQ